MVVKYKHADGRYSWRFYGPYFDDDPDEDQYDLQPLYGSEYINGRTYYVLRQEVAAWFTFHNAEHDYDRWFGRTIDIYDEKVALLFKITWV